MRKQNNTISVRESIDKSRWNLRAFRAAAVIVLGLLALSCTKDDTPPVCPTGNCEAILKAPYSKDENGYYRVELDYSQQYYPRFYLEVEADPTDSYWWYNNTPVVEAYFDSKTVLELTYEDVKIVQPGRIYLHGDKTKKLYGKRLVGPISPEMIGDTINISVEILWDAGENYIVKDFFANFILD